MKRPAIKRKPVNSRKGEPVLHGQKLWCQHICKHGKDGNAWTELQQFGARVGTRV